MTIASEIARLQQAKADLKTAINGKGQSIDDETLDEYAAFVDAIEVGGGGGTGDYLVRFVDYDGTVLKEEYVDSGEAATAPTSPDHTADGLTFVEWSNAYSNITHDLQVGAIYETTDGKTHAFITVTTVTGKDVVLYLNKSDASTLSVDWGDGSDVETFTNSGNFNTGTHTYASIGDYEIELWISSGSGTYGFGNGSSSTAFLDGGTDEFMLTKIYIGDDVSDAGDYAFYNCDNLERIIIPKTTVEIGRNIFENCKSLICVNLPSTTDTTGINTFAGCISLTTVTLPDTWTSIRYYSFYDCRVLRNVNMPSAVKLIGDYAFYNCYGLPEIVLPSGLTTLGEHAFRTCRGASKISPIPSGITVLDDYTFSGCSNITSIELPSSMTRINTYALASTGIVSIIVPPNVTTIESYAFIYNYSLKTVILPSGVTTINSRTFYANSATTLYDFSAHSAVPTLASVDAFDSINKACRILVPSALEATWKAATNWDTYADYIVGV